ncbi:MAG: LPS export ABC transporter permease LptF [Rhodospirillaceae bacterium]|nr:LPS export ABC transporter permease LptF [Rhodospirillaceae bacterium]MBT5459551.1 LPS export ABC transporter permease LptF [Rhodospirillaceae bacterium]
MKRIDRYIFRQLLTTTVFITVTLTGVVWLTQSLRFVEMIINRGLSAPLFLYFTMLLLPTFLGVILPIALFISVVFVYNRLLIDGELVVLRAGGCSQFAVSKPALILAGLVTIACYTLTIYLIPASHRTFKDMQYTLRDAHPTVLLQEGVFSNVMSGITVYVRSRGNDGGLSGIIVHDARNRERPVTMMAERGTIVSAETGPRIVLVTGSRQEVDEKDGRLSLLYFDRYSFDLDTASQGIPNRWREPRERYLSELFFSEDQAKTIGYYYKLRMEGHHRLSMPLLPLCFTLVSLALLLMGDFNRRGQMWRILSAIAIVFIVQVAQLGLKNLGEKEPNIAFLIYLIPLIPALAAVWLLNVPHLLQRRFPARLVADQG